MSKIVLDDVQGGYNLQKINLNFEKIETALNTEVLYRQNPAGEDNRIYQDIDMDGNDLINVGDVQINGHGSFKNAIEDVEQARDDAQNYAQQSQNSASQAASSAQTALTQASRAESEADKAEDEADRAEAEAFRLVNFEWLSAWNPSTEYFVNNLVEYQGESYICIEAHTSDVSFDAIKWDKVAAKGDPGAGTGDMLGANNLSDVADAVAARVNLGLGNVDNTSDADKPISSATQSALNNKQDTLVSGTNIKTVNGQSLLGSGDIAIAAGWKAHVMFNSGTYTLAAGKEYFVVAVGAGGRGARNVQASGRASGGNGGGVCGKAISPTSPLTLTVTVGSGSGLPNSTVANTNGVAGGNTTVTGTGVSMTAPGGAGGVQGTGTVQPGAPTTPTGGDINLPGGRAGAVSGSDSASAGASILGGGSVNVSATLRFGSPTSPADPGNTTAASSGTWALLFGKQIWPVDVDYRIALALLAISSQTPYAPVGAGAGGAKSVPAYPNDSVSGAGIGAGSGGVWSNSGSNLAVLRSGDGAVVIMEKL